MLAGLASPAPRPPHDGKQLLAFCKPDAGWKIAAASMSANAPLPER